MILRVAHMMTLRFPLVAACLLTLPAMTAYPHAEQQETNSSTVRPAHGVVIERYCMACHNDTLRTADVVLSGLDLSDVSKNSPLFVKGKWPCKWLARKQAARPVLGQSSRTDHCLGGLGGKACSRPALILIQMSADPGNVHRFFAAVRPN